MCLLGIQLLLLYSKVPKSQPHRINWVRIENFDEFLISIFFCLIIEVSSSLRDLPFKIANPRERQLSHRLSYWRVFAKWTQLFDYFAFWAEFSHRMSAALFLNFYQRAQNCWFSGTLWAFNGVGCLSLRGAAKHSPLLGSKCCWWKFKTWQREDGQPNWLRFFSLAIWLTISWVPHDRRFLRFSEKWRGT